MTDRGTSIGIGLCHGSFESGAAPLLPALPGFDAQTIPDTAIVNTDMLVSAGLSQSGHVVIPDDGLRRAVEQALGKRTHEPISPVEMAGLTDLAARRADISDLSGLEFAVRLKHLDLDLNSISDVTPLAGLSSLEMLSLARNRIRDDAFSTLSRLTGLEVLSLAGNALDDLSPLAGLPRLRVLDLASTATNDVSPLQGLMQLEGLYLGDNGIEDITALGGLNRLKWLLLGDNGIEDIAPLSALTDLRALSLGGNAVEDLSPLAGLSALETLVLAVNAIEDISALAGLVELQLLHLNHNAIADISPLAGLTGLRELALSHNAIKDISALAGLTNLEWLWLRNNEIEDLSALAGLTELVFLSLEDNALVDISVLAGLTGLQTLRLSGNFVDDISVLTGLARLRQLGLSRMGITDEDLAVLAGLTRLSRLDLGINDIADISVLARLTGLWELNLQRNAIEDLSPLAELRRLVRLNLSGNAIRDLVPLTGLRGLIELDLSSNAVEDISGLVLNDGLDQGDVVVLSGNPLSPASRDQMIPDLRARGVEVHFDDDGQVSIPDDGLRSAVESALGKEPGDAITADEMGELTELVVVSAGIEDLTGLEHAVNLTRLELDNNNVKDLSPLAELWDLQWLSLLYNSIEDLSPLAGLTALEVLDLGSNVVEDISPLSGLTVLKVLSLWRNTVSDLSPLAGLTALQVLDVDSNAVDDISPLSELAALEVLSLRNNAVEDVSPLVDNTGLDDGDFVSLTGNPLSGQSTGVHIPALEARGVDVEFDAGVEFSEQRVITTNADAAQSVHAVDLDGDGDADVLSASWEDNKVAWYENMGGGSFSAQRVITTDAIGAASVYAADLDGDGDADVLSASQQRNMIAWYENEGGGTFSTQRVIATDAFGARSVHAADLDGDGDPDVLANDDHQFVWYENEGGGAFSAKQVIATVATAAWSVHATDLDGDGDPDVLASDDARLVWYANEGGAFSPRRIFDFESGSRWHVHSADLDGDGDVDVVTNSDADVTIAWHENLGGGEFSTQRRFSGHAQWGGAVRTADLDGDGDLDVLSASRGDDKIAWYENEGGGSFSAQRVITTDADGAYSIDAVDLDGDGDPDVLSASAQDDKIAWYENLSDHGDDHGNAPTSATLATAFPAFLHGTLESGGDRDVFRVATGSGTLRVYSNGPTDTFGSLIDADGAVLAQNDDADPTVANPNFRIEVEVNAGTHYIEVRGYDGETTGPYTLSIEFEAQRAPVFDSEGPPDQSYTSGTAIVELTLPAASGGSGALEYSLTPEVPGLSFDPATRRLSGTPTEAGTFAMTYSATDANGNTVSWTFSVSVVALFAAERVITTEADVPNSVHAADLDGDGDLDVLSASWVDDKIAWYENQGGGAFSAQRVVTTAADGANSVYAADLDSDGDADVLSASWQDAKIAWYENLGGGALSTQRVIAADARGASSVHAADFDGDGDADVLSTSADADQIAWYENEGEGAFSRANVITTDVDSPLAALAADLDGDGDPDVLSASRNDDKIAWYENLGGGEFSAQRILSNDADGARAVHAADLDEDGDLDVLFASSQDHKIAWVENLGGGQFAEQRIISTDGQAPFAIDTADLNGDGRQDVLSVWFSSLEIAWHENLGGGAFSPRSVIGRGPANSVYAGDLDNDGDPDLLGAWQNGGTITWYENLSNHGDDHGDAPASATLTTALPAFLHGTVESGGDRDVFRVATGNGTLRVYSSGPTDTYGRLLDADGGELAANDDSGVSTNFMFDVEVEPGVHYVEVRGFNSAITGPYTLSIDFVAAEDAAVRLTASFGLDDENTHSAGVVYANNRFYIVDSVDRKVYAYASDWQRDAAADFNVAEDSSWPLGITYANNRFYIVDIVDHKVYAYRADGQRDASADFELDDATVDPRGIAYENGRFYVADDHRDKVFAYRSDGQRDAAADFDLHYLNFDADGMVYANERFYVVNGVGTPRVWSYRSGGQRDAATEFDPDDENSEPWGIAYHNGQIYLIDDNRRVYSYAVPAGASGDTSPSFPEGSRLDNRTYTVGTAIDPLTLPAASGGDGALTYSLLGRSIPGLVFDATTRRLTGIPTEGRIYRASYTVSDADGDTDTLTFTIDVASVSGTLFVDGDSRSTGITYANGRFYVLNQFGWFDVYWDSGWEDHLDEFGWEGDSNLEEQGITAVSDGGVISLYIVNREDALVYVLRPYQSSAYRDPAWDFDLFEDNADPRGIAFDVQNDWFYVVDNEDARVYQYEFTGRGVAANDFDLHEDNGDPRGIAYADGRLYVVDGEDSKVYAYRSGRRDAAADFDLHADNGSPEGIIYANGRFYVVGYLGRVYAYAERDSGVDVAQFLQERPRIAAAMLWSGTDNQPKPYAEWPQTLKGKLDLAVRRQLKGDGSGLPDVMTNRTSGVLDDDDAATLTVLSKEDAEDLYVANISHSLVLEITGALPWSLEELSEHELALLFSASPIGSGLQGSNIQGLRRGGFYDQYEDVAGVTGYIVHGRVLPAPPELVHGFLTQENLIGDSRHETIIRAIEWARYNLVHYCCGFSLGSVEEQWGYRGAPPLARMLFPTITTTTKYSDDAIRGYTAGCHGTNWFLMQLLRAVNIPVEYIRWAGHAIPSFPTEGLYLSHGDDPYSGFGQYWPPFPEPFPTSEIPISEATYQEWFSSFNSSEDNLRNVGRRMTELGVEYLPPVLLEARCRDRANGATNESSEVYGPTSFGIPRYWTVAELEAMQFWERMDTKIEEYGGCSIFDA